MPTFYYKAKKGPEEIVEGEVSALTRNDAVSQIEVMGLVPVQITERVPKKTRHKEKKRSAPRSFFRYWRVRPQDIDIFTRQLASLVRTSVPILRALHLITLQTKNESLRLVVEDFEKQVRDGKMLSEALSKYPRYFNTFYINMLRSGEKSGALDEALENLAQYREKELEIKRRIQAALAYPILIGLVGFATVFIMLTYFMPKFISLFETMKQTLPLPTQMLIGISNFMTGNWYWFLIGIALLAALFGRSKAGSKRKLIIDMLKLHVPFFKEFIKQTEIAKFSRTMEILLRNGLSVYDSLRLATDTLDNDALIDRLRTVGDDIINKGATLSTSLESAQVFPPFVINMIAVGEEGGRLEEALAEIALSYEKTVDQKIKVITSLLEPLLILVVGSIVGFIVFALLLPIFNMGQMGR